MEQSYWKTGILDGWGKGRSNRHYRHQMPHLLRNHDKLVELLAHSLKPPFFGHSSSRSIPHGFQWFVMSIGVVQKLDAFFENVCQFPSEKNKNKCGLWKVGSWSKTLVTFWVKLLQRGFLYGVDACARSHHRINGNHPSKLLWFLLGCSHRKEPKGTNLFQTPCQGKEVEEICPISQRPKENHWLKGARRGVIFSH